MKDFIKEKCSLRGSRTDGFNGQQLDFILLAVCYVTAIEAFCCGRLDKSG